MRLTIVWIKMSYIIFAYHDQNVKFHSVYLPLAQ